MTHLFDQQAADRQRYIEELAPSSQAQVILSDGTVFSPWRNIPGELDIDWEAMRRMPDKRPYNSGQDIGELLMSGLPGVRAAVGPKLLTEIINVEAAAG